MRGASLSASRSISSAPQEPRARRRAAWAARAWRDAVPGGYGERMGDIDEKKLSVDFSQDRDLEAIKAKVLAFLKDDVAESGLLPA
jgi:hypothetical protein